MKALISCLLLLVAGTVCACLNKVGTKYGGGSGSYFGWRQLQRALKADLHFDGMEMEATLRTATNFTDRSDYAVALMYLGRASEAVELLQRLETERPGEYFVAANLGTAYELAGNNQAAWQWIREGIRRNPASHEGTEWLHVKILEAKISQQKEPAFFEHHSVLELQPEDIQEKIVIETNRFAPKKLIAAIQHQLAERLQFVKPPDAAVASLLYDYAVIEAATASMESARHILAMATEYGYPAAKVNMLNQAMDRRLAWNKAKTFLLYGLAGSAILAVLVILYRRGIFVLSRKRPTES